MRTAARSKGVRQSRVSQSVTIPAPVGGWNARDPSAQMPATDAVALVNFFPGTAECKLRYGYTQHATGLPGQVESLMDYEGGIASELYAACGSGFYNVTAAGAVGEVVVTGLSNARWQYANFATAGGDFMYCANGVDYPQLYDGSEWTQITGLSTPAITGVTATHLNTPIVFKNRLFFVEQGTLKTWYLPTSSIGGAANPIDLSAVAQLGGTVTSHCTWTIDAGVGVDDYYAIVTSKGEVIVYQGTDPSSATTWALKGVWRVGAPVGARCFTKLGGDVLLICQDGVLPLSSALQSSRVNPRVALTDKIQWAMSTAVTQYGGNYGWELFYFPGENQLWLNVPVTTDGQQQYSMNTITKNWCSYEGWAANCFVLFGDHPYFGSNGTVCRAWDGNADNGASITAVGLQAFSTYGFPGVLKKFSMMRPILRTTGAPALLGSINVDFSEEISSAPLSFASVSTGLWDVGVWDGALWGGELTIYQDWQGVSGVGYYAAPQLKVSASLVDLRWVSTDIVFEVGATL